MRISSVLPLVFCLALGIGSASAAQLTWDPLLNGGTASGSSNWDITAGNAIWWNGTSDVLWSQTATNSATQGAIFNGPDAAPGTYAINIDAGIVAATNLAINNSGYTFSGNPIYFPTDSSATSGNDVGVAPNKSVTFNCGMAGFANGNGYWVLGSGATMTVAGNIATSGTGQQLRMLGASGSTLNMSGFNTLAIPYILAPSINLTGGSLSSSGNFFIGYNQTINGTVYNTGTLTVSGGTVSENGGIFIIARGAGTGTLIIQNGGTVDVGTTKAEPLAINYDGNAGNVATVDVQGGTLQVDSSSFFGSKILFYDSGAAASNSTSVLTQEGGTISAWGGIVFGNPGGAVGSSASLTQTGGALDVGPSGITKGATYSGTLGITLSGGTVGDLSTPGWSSSLPMTLGTTGGNVSFNPGNTITLSGALTGAGGLNVTSGTLVLTGADNYSGSTGVSSSGTLAISTGSSPSSGGTVTVDGALGTPTLTVNTTPGDSWSIGGGLTFQNNTTALNFQFNTLPPNPSVAPIQVTGSVAFTATPNVTIGGSGIAKGTYPLITYTGSLTGTMPTTVTTWQGGSASAGTIFNSGKTIYLQVTASSINAPLYWQAGNGAWNFGSPNWTQSSAPADYSDGDAVIFDDSATGTGPFTVTLSSVVNPGSVTFNNISKSYTLTNTGGGITGSGALSLLGSGTNTLAGANTYNGGTVLSAGQLNINNGGSGSASAIGTGTLTINSGAIDNTSGSDVTLQPSIPEVWNGNFTYLGSANNFNAGAGGVTLSNNISFDVNAMDFTIGGAVFDNFNGYQITKTGNGALTLAVDNNFGGVTLASGQLNLGSAAAAGTALTINAPGGCEIDNSSGGPLTLSSSSYTWTTGFEFIGSANLDFGSATITGNTDPLPPSVQVDGSAVMSTEGQLNFGNVSIYKYGTGTWSIGGTVGNSVSLFVEAGEVDLNKNKAQAVNGHQGLNVFNGALVKDSGVGTNYDYQMHSDTPGSPQTVTLQGGTWDLNGHNENVDILDLANSGAVPGILRNSASASSPTFDLISGNTAQLSGTNCQFEVDAVDGILNFKGPIAGSGSLVKTGLGMLNLLSNNTYTGSTVISNGTIALTNSGSINSSPLISIAAGATFDVSGVDPYTLSGSTTLNAGGAGFVPLNNAATINDSAAGGVVSLGSQPISLTFTPSNFTGDTAHPSLYISAGALTLGGNAVTVNNAAASPLGLGAYTVIQVAGGTITGAPAAAATVTGTGLVAGTEAYLSVSGGNVNLVVTPIRRASINPALGAGPHLTLAGTHGTTNGTYRVFTSTNVSAPLSGWMQIGSGNFDGGGNFSFGITNTNNPAQFYILEEP